ncbi:DUF177 domain-containing protein [Acidisoma sp. S159]|jgi:hypothetical protein|uniref:YceD family protein n=2 Tax=unclassified Acidisoma TaxID=2634065 RepID=UPI001C20ACF0|nr:DUF177 domain-containing protein [Acidisoma sp. S159]
MPPIPCQRLSDHPECVRAVEEAAAAFRVGRYNQVMSKAATPQEPAPEFSRLLPVGQIGALGTERELTATPEERALIAKRLGLEGLPMFSATVRVAQQKRGGGFLAEGRLRARARRVCVVSLDTFTEPTDHTFSLRFVTEDKLSELDPTESELPDEVVYDGEAIDLGEALVEEYALALAPYPKKPGAKLPVIEEPEASPFAVLKNLKLPN